MDSTEIFHRSVSAFIQRYAPRSHEGRDFELELRRILSRAFDEGQKPFVHELNTYRKIALDTATLKPYPASLEGN